ncbi:MAG: SprT family zinc-dependent metalloprotease [Clostridiaceae bacterium]
MNILGVEIEIVRKKIKNMHLSVLPPAGRVRVSAPIETSDETIQLFVITKIGWIKKQIIKFETQSRQTEREYITGESHYLWGQRYRLEIKYSNIGNMVEVKTNKIVLSVREASTTKQRENVMTEWYREEIKAKLPDLVAKWENSMEIQASAVGVKNMLTRWGTCNTKDKRIWINLQLAKKPVECLEYVVVHELVHLLEKNHTPQFISHMDRYLPYWRVTKEELNSFIMDEYLEE